jgi:hypothetical protein
LNSILPAGASVSVTQTDLLTLQDNTPNPNPLVPTDTGNGFVYTITFGGNLAGTTLPLTASGISGTDAAASLVAEGGTDTLVSDGAELQLDNTLAGASGLTVGNYILTLNGSGISNDGALRNIKGNNTWAGPVVLQTSSAVGADSGTSVTLSGGVAGGNGLDLTKDGGGTLIFPPLSGSLKNTFPSDGGPGHGLTIVSAGSVQVDGTGTSGIGAVLLNGGTISGNGDGTNANVGAITSNQPASGSGGTVDPGDNFPAEDFGKLTSSGASVLNPTDSVFMDLGTSGSDVWNIINGSVDLGGATLTGLVDPAVAIGTVFDIIQTDHSSNPADTVTGQFAGAPLNPGDTIEAGATSANITWIDGAKFIANYFPDHVDVVRVLADLTSFTLAASVAAPVYGQPETFTATLTPEASAPPLTGNVVFTVTDPNNNTTTYTIPIDPSTDSATWDPTAAAPAGIGEPLQLGKYTVKASFDGIDSAGAQVFNPPPDTSPVSVAVIAAGTRTALKSSAASGTTPVYGQNISFTATVTSVVNPEATGTLAPGGTVSFYDGSGSSKVLLAKVTLDSTGVAVLHNSDLSTFLTPGTHVISAVYNGDAVPANYTGSTSSSVTQRVNQDGTTTTLLSSENPSAQNDSVTFTATVTPKLPGGGNPTGTVTFSLNGNVLGTGQLSTSGGVTTATFTTSTLPLGLNQTVTASYPGDTNFTSSSGTLKQSVVAFRSATSLSSSDNPSFLSEKVTFTAVVANAGSGSAPAPTGTVTFKDGNTTLGTATLSTANGVTSASLSTSSLALGGHTITASYGGDSNYSASSATLSQNVGPDTRTASQTNLSAPKPSPSTYGQTVTFTATVTGSGNTPTGIVEFFDGTTKLGQSNLFNGTAKLLFTGLSVGSHNNITATYDGDNNFKGSSSSAVTETVNKASSSVTLQASAASAGSSITFTATVGGVFDGLTPNQRFVTAAFEKVLGRAPDSNAQRDSLASLLDQGLMTPGQLASILTHSAEYYSDFVTAAYQKYLLRSPDAFGLAGWVSAMQNGLSDEQLEAGFVSSPEYINDNGGMADLTTWVKSLYKNLLGRNSPSQAEVNGWLSALNNGVTVGQVAFGFTASLEREAIRVIGDYQTYLNRTPSQAEVQGWVTAFQNGVSNEDVIAGFVGSPEFYNDNVNLNLATPTGTVTFSVDGQGIGSANLNSAGQASLVDSAGLSAGQHTVQASYSGDGNYDLSSATITVSIASSSGGGGGDGGGGGGGGRGT